jgi:hypothetical protein
VIADNVKRLCEISGLDEVSFHMSGTEAVMQAVRLAQFHTRRRRIVRFCGAYHGWWGDVQPGVGNPLPARETYTLKEMSADTLHVLRTTIGDDAFFRLLRTWVARNRYGNVTTADFTALAEQVSHRDLDALFTAWLSTPGKPSLPGHAAAGPPAAAAAKAAPSPATARR